MRQRRNPKRSAATLGLDPATGWLGRARQVPSPNCDERPAGTAPDLIVLHGISLPPGEFGGPWIDRLFTNQLPPDAHPFFMEIAGRTFSAHVLIRRDGEVVQYVPFGRRAWHAGESSWEGRSRCNDFSVGIELEGTDSTPYEPAQYAAVSRLIAELIRGYPALDPGRIVGHSDIAPGRKTDPGLAFDWPLLRALVRFELEAGPA
jgi:AmpD protein